MRREAREDGVKRQRFIVRSSKFRLRNSGSQTLLALSNAYDYLAWTSYLPLSWYSIVAEVEDELYLGHSNFQPGGSESALEEDPRKLVMNIDVLSVRKSGMKGGRRSAGTCLEDPAETGPSAMLDVDEQEYIDLMIDLLESLPLRQG
jgi:hypothetical protein